MDVPDVAQEPLLFFAVGDWGEDNLHLKSIADAMNTWATTFTTPKFILSLGDNFYPRGVKNVKDPRFQSQWGHFTNHASLKVPWYLVLGNHDYGNPGSPKAQIQYSHVDPNWNMPSKNFKFSKELPGGGTVDFFAFDTNALSGAVSKNHPETIIELSATRDWLGESLLQSTANWKIAFAHHPMYTKSKKHGESGLRLRANKYVDHQGNPSEGFGFEQVFIDGKVDAYLTGHEHALEAHCAHGIHHFVAGAVSRIGLYGGNNLATTLDYVNLKQRGFMVLEMTKQYMKIKLVDAQCNTVYEITKTKSDT